MNGRVTLRTEIKLNTQVDGDEGLPWIILSNSLGANLSMWEPQIPLLTQSYRVLRYDTRGHGSSDAPSGPYSFDDLLGDVMQLMDAFGIETSAFMGLSLGGMTGLGLAIHHSDRISRVVCADARADAPEPFRDMWDQRMAAVEAGGLDAIADGTLATWFTEDWRTSHPDEAAAIRKMVTSNDADGYIACCLALKELDYLKSLGQAKSPIFYVGGSDDMGAAPEVMQAMADATPGGAYRKIPGAAHVSNINAPAAFNAAISEFLGLG